MISLRRILGVAAGLVVLSSMLACGAVGSVRQAAAKAKTRNDLMQLGLLYHSYNDANKKGPPNMTALQNFDKDPSTQAIVAQTGPGGMYVLIWDVKIADLAKAPGGAGSVILGYQSQVPTLGGQVLMGDGSVREMTPNEFNTAPKAQPSK